MTRIFLPLLLVALPSFTWAGASLIGDDPSVTIATGTITAFQGGSYTVTPGTGVWTVGFASGSFSNPIYVISTATFKIASVPITPVLSSVTCNGTSTQIFAANTSRIAFECQTMSTNNRDIFLKWNGAATVNDWPMEPSAYYSPPITVIPQTSLNCITAGTSQGIRCFQY